jgi:DNA-binding GntR family transcriptional regulator
MEIPHIFRPSGAATIASLEGVELDKDSSVTLHAQLSDVMRGRIYSRQWTTGTKIPSEHDLMAHFGLARGTVRRAIRTLVDEGLLVQHHGRGTFVAEAGLSHPAGVRPLSFAESLREQGKDYTTKILRQEILPAPEDIANDLQMMPGQPCLFLRRVRSVAGKPVICQESWSNLAVVPGLDKVDFTQLSGFEATEMCSGKRIKYSRIRYTARVAGKEHGEYLDCDENAPLLVLEQIISFEDHMPFEWNITWLTHGQSVVGDAVQPL